jgi:ribosomal-protein-alanine N-acetyltransferase
MSLPMTDRTRVLETPRLRLRDWRDEDLAPFAAMNADPEVMRFFPDVQSREESDEGAARIRLSFDVRGWGFWAAEHKPDNRFIGFIGLNVPLWTAHFTPCVDVGWRLARPYWGQGLATEGARAALAFGFGELLLPEVVSITVPDNAPSRNVMAKLGMAHDTGGDFDHPRIPEGSPRRRHVLYRLSRENYLRQQS